MAGKICVDSDYFQPSRNWPFAYILQTLHIQLNSAFISQIGWDITNISLTYGNIDFNRKSKHMLCIVNSKIYLTSGKNWTCATYKLCRVNCKCKCMHSLYTKAGPKP